MMSLTETRINTHKIVLITPDSTGDQKKRLY